MEFNNIRLITGTLFFFLLFSCSNDTSTIKSKPKSEKQDPDRIINKNDSLTIVPNREGIRNYHSSSSQFGQAFRELLFQGEEMSINEILSKEITLRNNEGKMITVPVKEVVDTMYFN